MPAPGRWAHRGCQRSIGSSLFSISMHEATEQTGARDPVSWLVFLGSLGISFVGLVALESSQVFGARAGKPVVVAPDDDRGRDGITPISGRAWQSAPITPAVNIHSASCSLPGLVCTTGPRDQDRRRGRGEAADVGAGCVAVGADRRPPDLRRDLLSGQGVSSYFSICFYSLAAGLLLYVVLSLTAMSYTVRRAGGCGHVRGNCDHVSHGHVASRWSAAFAADEDDAPSGRPFN